MAGLMTVVVQDTDQKPLRQISGEVKTMAGRAREGKAKPADIEGSTFSTSNLGMYDVEEFIAIINPPEAAILAIGSAKEMPVVEKGEIQIGWPLSRESYDLGGLPCQRRRRDRTTEGAETGRVSGKAGQDVDVNE
jgi:hypothetical protein